MSSFDDAPTSIQCLIVAAGTDYRAYEPLRKIRSAGVDLGELIVVNFLEREEAVRKAGLADNYFEFRDLVSCPVQEVSASFSDPAEFFQKIVSLSPLDDEATAISIDISCFTKPFFFGLLKLFGTVLNRLVCNVIYTEPRSYVFREGLFDSFHASSGPTTVTELPSFVGRPARATERVLVIQLGFEGLLAREITEDVAPVRTILVNGFPGLAPKFKDISLISNEKLVGADSNKRICSRANNPFDSYNALDSILMEHGEKFFINIAPLGTKPMALGACLVALHNPNVRIIYPHPEEYALEFTHECCESWFYVVPLTLSEGSARQASALARGSAYRE
ncbi:MAG: hypothetical protein AAF756_21625 [Pseudomonadota bacterium]